MEAKDVRTLMEAYASVYEGYGKKKKGDCVSKSEKGDHNCAKKVCHEQYGEGETIFGQHAVPDENGFVSHYDVQFEHGIVENVSVEDMDILTMEAHGEHVEHEGETISEMGMKPAPSTRGPKKPTSAPRADRKPAPSTRAPKKPSPAPRADRKPAPKAPNTAPPMKEELSIDEGMLGALKKVAKIGVAAAGAAAAGKALEKATSSKKPTRDEEDAADAKKHLDHYRKSGKMMRSEEKTAADPGMKARMGKEPPKKGGYKLPERTPANAKNVEYYKDDADLFDIVKGHLMDEGLCEKEALEKMLTLTDEERQSIVEQNMITRTGTSTNAAGEKIKYTHKYDKSTGRSTVTDKYGTRDSTPVKRGEKRYAR